MDNATISLLEKFRKELEESSKSAYEHLEKVASENGNGKDMIIAKVDGDDENEIQDQTKNRKGFLESSLSKGIFAQTLFKEE